ncbi:MAG: NAD(P)H-binding protein [Acidobacteria bacterium]|nr:NAD(P)H-binding protein [Acidobacteriota bacterium]
MIVFVTGGTGYIGRPLIDALLARGHDVHALVRPGSEGKLPRGAVPVRGNALDAETFASKVPEGATVVHLVGTPHPNPAKAAEFRRVDLASIQATVAAAVRARVRHLVYVSVAHPAPVMKAYIAARQEGEAAVRASGVPATIVRPWYVLGPGHRWPYLLVPVYAVLRHIAATREGARRLALVTRGAMVAALLRAVEEPPAEAVRVLGVPEIQRSAAST